MESSLYCISAGQSLKIDFPKGQCNEYRGAQGNPLVCDYVLHGLALMGCSNIHLYTNIKSSISWIKNLMYGETLDCSNRDSWVKTIVRNNSLDQTVPMSSASPIGLPIPGLHNFKTLPPEPKVRSFHIDNSGTYIRCNVIFRQSKLTAFFRMN